MPLPDAFMFDTAGMRPQGSDLTGPCWLTLDGDAIDLSPQGQSPRYRLDAHGLQQHREETAAAATRQAAGLVELACISVLGRPALLTILKMAQEPTGRVYIGSLELLFRDFSYTVKVVCYEQGTTGIRETTLVQRFLGSGQVRFTDAGLECGKTGAVLGPEYMHGWLVDWLSTPVPAHLALTIGEDRCYDVEFPDHPLSRARRTLSHIQATASLSDDLMKATPYAGAPASWWSRIARAFGAA